MANVSCTNSQQLKGNWTKDTSWPGKSGRCANISFSWLYLVAVSIFIQSTFFYFCFEWEPCWLTLCQWRAEREKENELGYILIMHILRTYLWCSVLHRERERENKPGHILIMHVLRIYLWCSAFSSQRERGREGRRERERERERENEPGHILITQLWTYLWHPASFSHRERHN